jgi:hypothetical protein
MALPTEILFSIPTFQSPRIAPIAHLDIAATEILYSIPTFQIARIIPTAHLPMAPHT